MCGLFQDMTFIKLSAWHTECNISQIYINNNDNNNNVKENGKK